MSIKLLKFPVMPKKCSPKFYSDLSREENNKRIRLAETETVDNAPGGKAKRQS